jgi:hypothetical protein
MAFIISVMENLFRAARPLFLLALLAVYLLAPCSPFSSAGAAETNPWSQAQTVSPADFAKELQNHDASLKIVYVGVRTLYSGAHIPGSVFHGPGSTDQGLSDLKKFAVTLPKGANIVIYCGCCPLERCPNLRPAFSTLKEMGFTHLRVLILPTDFAADWIEKGYPVEKGS